MCCHIDIGQWQQYTLVLLPQYGGQDVNTTSHLPKVGIDRNVYKLKSKGKSCFILRIFGDELSKTFECDISLDSARTCMLIVCTVLIDRWILPINLLEEESLVLV